MKLQNPQFSHLQETSDDKSPDLLIRNNFMSFDEILSKIGFGSYQIKCYLFIGLILIFDGAEAIVLSLVQNILRTEWNLTSNQVSFLATAVFSGFLLGSLLAGKISDRYGRRKPLLYFVPLLYLIGMLSAFANSYETLILIRAAYGCLIGIQFPICFTYLTEITPKESRGKYLILAGGFFTLGELLTCGSAFFTLDGVSSGNWRLLIIIVAQPALLCWLGLFYLYESPRYLMTVKKDFDKGFDILMKIADENKKNDILNTEDRERLQRWSDNNDKNQSENKVARISALFTDRTKYITMYLWPVWFVLCLSYYGMVAILPQIVQVVGNQSSTVKEEQSNPLWSILLPHWVNFPQFCWDI